MKAKSFGFQISLIQILILLFLFLSRLVYIFSHQDLLGTDGLNSSLVDALIYGFRFDLSATAYLGIIPALYIITLLWMKKPLVALELGKYIFTLYYAFIGYLVISLTLLNYWFYGLFWEPLRDAAYRYNWGDWNALMALTSETTKMAWLIAGLLGGLAFATLTFLRLKNTEPNTERTVKQKKMITNFILVGTTLVARGSLGKLPLGHFPVDEFENPFLNFLASQFIHDSYKILLHWLN